MKRLDLKILKHLYKHKGEYVAVRGKIKDAEFLETKQELVNLVNKKFVHRNGADENDNPTYKILSDGIKEYKSNSFLLNPYVIGIITGVIGSIIVYLIIDLLSNHR